MGEVQLFPQNNSYGIFKVETPSAYYFVVVNAKSPQEATEALIQNSNGGFYLDYEYNIDCPCCGTRWDKFPEKGTLETILNYLDFTNIPANHNLVGIFDCKTKTMTYCSSFEDAETILTKFAIE